MDDTTYCCGTCNNFKTRNIREFQNHLTQCIKNSSLDKQVDGDHYKKLEIQPATYSYKNFGPGWHQGEIIKYVSRYRDKNGVVDLEKAKHLIEMLIELENGEI